MFSIYNKICIEGNGFSKRIRGFFPFDINNQNILWERTMPYHIFSKSTKAAAVWKF